jgi:hypothetical protein
LLKAGFLNPPMVLQQLFRLITFTFVEQNGTAVNGSPLFFFVDTV